MITRFKLIAAALGLVVATSAIGDASAKTIVKTVKTHGVAGARVTKVISHRPYRVHLGARIVKHVRIVHRAPSLVKVVHVAKRPLWHGHVASRHVVTRTFVR